MSKKSLKDRELEELVYYVTINGEDDLYVILKDRAVISAIHSDSIDNDFMDMYGFTLNKARVMEIKCTVDEVLCKMLYSISFALRRVAHFINREYVRNGIRESDSRFLRLVSNNKEILVNRA